MRAIFFSVLCFLLTGTVLAQGKTDRERDGLKGAVHTVRVRTTTTLDENGNQSSSPLLLSYVVTYGKSGNRDELALYNSVGALSRRIVYTYDPESKRKSGLITYDSQNTMIRKVIDLNGSGGFKKTRTIYDFKEDGTVYRRMEMAFDELGQLIEVAEYDPDGSPLKKERSPFIEPELKNVVPAQKARSQDIDRVVSFGGGYDEYFEPDPRGNWTRGKRVLSSRTYASGKKVKTTEVVYRELNYYQD
jgi:hypothetical protein